MSGAILLSSGTSVYMVDPLELEVRQLLVSSSSVCRGDSVELVDHLLVTVDGLVVEVPLVFYLVQVLFISDLRLELEVLRALRNGDPLIIEHSL